MPPSSIRNAQQKESAILDEIETIGVQAETEGRDLREEEVARIESLSKEFDVCEATIGHDPPGRSQKPPVAPQS